PHLILTNPSSWHNTPQGLLNTENIFFIHCTALHRFISCRQPDALARTISRQTSKTATGRTHVRTRWSSPPGPPINERIHQSPQTPLPSNNTTGESTMYFTTAPSVHPQLHLEPRLSAPSNT
ncbi:unnamed protein product, partial [Ectocarpus sp. 12 AP-2014]